MVMKTHECNAVVGDIPLIPAGLSGPSIYLVRDPRDVAVSYADHMGLDLDTAIKRITSEGTSVAANAERGSLPQVLSSWSKHVQSWASRDYVRTVRYEDLLADSQEFRKVLEQYGLDYDQAKFANSVEKTSFAALRQAEYEDGFREKGKRQARFFRNGKAGAWREVLNNEQVSRLEAVLGQEMKKQGYELENT